MESIKQGSEVVGCVTPKIMNKCSPFRQAEFDLIYGQGISREAG